MPNTVRDDLDLTDWIPEDTFGVRLAIIRAVKRWNVLKAATACGLDSSSWTNWERDLTKPHDYELICKKIAAATGCNLNWLANGGPLPVRSRCTPLGELRVIPGGRMSHGQMIQTPLPLFAQVADN